MLMHTTVMSTMFSISHQEYGLPAQVSFDFDRREGIVVSTHVSVSGSPSVEINFWMDSSKHHHGQYTSSLLGGVSPQSRQRETLAWQVANDIYEKYAILQKKAAYSPGATIAMLMSLTTTPDNETEQFLASIPSARHEFQDGLSAACKQSALAYRVISSLVNEDKGSSNTEEILSGLSLLRKRILSASRYLTNQGDKSGPAIKSIYLSQMKKEYIQTSKPNEETLL